jgi:hypothetical protein
MVDFQDEKAQGTTKTITEKTLFFQPIARETEGSVNYGESGFQYETYQDAESNY